MVRVALGWNDGGLHSTVGTDNRKWINGWKHRDMARLHYLLLLLLLLLLMLMLMLMLLLLGFVTDHRAAEYSFCRRKKRKTNTF